MSKSVKCSPHLEVEVRPCEELCLSEKMEKRDMDRLRQNRSALLDIDLSKISNRLIKEGVFSRQKMDEILASKTVPKGQMSSLLTELLENGGEHAYGKFRHVLNHFAFYKHLVEKLDSTKVDVGEVEAQPVRQEGSSTSPSGSEHGGGQVVHNTVCGKGNIAIFGGTNTTINMK